MISFLGAIGETKIVINLPGPMRLTSIKQLVRFFSIDNQIHKDILLLLYKGDCLIQSNPSVDLSKTVTYVSR